MKQPNRNLYVESSVDRAIQTVDDLVNGQKLENIPSAPLRKGADSQLEHKSNSVRLASLFFAFYSIEDTNWDFNGIPKGLRGKWGDKKLANEMNLRDITLHNAITAFGENMGWKGNVEAFQLKTDQRFSNFLGSLEAASKVDRETVANYMAWRFAESRKVIAPIPPVADNVLTYARGCLLFERLLSIPSEGNIQQFLVASFLAVHRSRFGHDIRTHHVHASDKFDSTAGDIEEFREGELIGAYEITVRPDWKNRLSDFKAKMDSFSLKKYTIIASAVNRDHELAQPASMLRFLEPYGRDLAIVDIDEFMRVFTAELSAAELRKVITQTFDYLRNPKLCGRHDIIEKYSDCIGNWLDG